MMMKIQKVGAFSLLSSYISELSLTRFGKGLLSDPLDELHARCLGKQTYFLYFITNVAN